MTIYSKKMYEIQVF